MHVRHGSGGVGLILGMEGWGPTGKVWELPKRYTLLVGCQNVMQMQTSYARCPTEENRTSGIGVEVTATGTRKRLAPQFIEVWVRCIESEARVQPPH